MKTEIEAYQETPEILTVMAAVPDLREKITALEIMDDQTDTTAKTYIAQISGHVKSAEAEYRKHKDPIVKRGRELDLAFKAITEPLEGLKKALSEKVFEYQERREAEARAEAERVQKLADEAERKRQEEIANAQREADEAAALLAAAENDGDRQAAADLVREAEEKTTEAVQAPVCFPATPMVQPPQRSTKTSAGTVSVGCREDIVIVSPDQIPREYCEPSLPKLRAALKLGMRNIPGTRIDRVAQTNTRAVRS